MKHLISHLYFFQILQTALFFEVASAIIIYIHTFVYNNTMNTNLLILVKCFWFSKLKVCIQKNDITPTPPPSMLFSDSGKRMIIVDGPLLKIVQENLYFLIWIDRNFVLNSEGTLTNKIFCLISELSFLVL